MTKTPFAVRPKRLKQLLRRLIDIYSPSGKEEEILSYLHGYLRRHGLTVHQQPVDGSRYNLLVIPPETEVSLALIGHIDTVMAYELEHFGYEEQGDLIYGLGAADMKGGCAAIIESYLSLVESGLSRPPVALALVVGEEEEGDGARRLARDFHFPRAIIAEPTNLQPCLSHYGYLEVHITTHGTRMHASLANKVQNPIETMLRLLLKLTHYIASERPEIVYNIRELSSSKSGFAVPDRCDVWLDIHLPPPAPLGEITLELEEILARERQESADLHGNLRFVTIHSGYELPQKGSLVQALQDVYAAHAHPWEPQAFRSHSDANILWAAGIKSILLGPGQLERAHTPDEAIPFPQVLLAAQFFHDTMRALKR